MIEDGCSILNIKLCIIYSVLGHFGCENNVIRVLHCVLPLNKYKTKSLFSENVSKYSINLKKKQQF